MRRAAMTGMILAALAASTALAGPVAAPALDAALQVQPLARPYDETADAHARVDQALAEATSSGRRVLLDFGGNWCPDCRVLGGVLALDPVRRFVAARYVVVPVDIGRFDRNLDLPARFGVKLDAVPAVLVLDGEGTLLNAGHVLELGDARTMTPQAIADWLALWAPPATPS